MTTVTNGRVLFNEIPTGYPDPNRTVLYDESQQLDLNNVPLKGGILVKTLYLSIDPYMRNRMRDPSIVTYNRAFTKGEPIDNFGLGLVVRSEDPSFKVGDHAYGIFPFQQHIVFEDTTRVQVLPNEEKLPFSLYVGVLGMPGQTAWYAWQEYAFPKKGETVFVTAGSGPVGATVIQLAKLDGLKVIASAGSDEKVEWIKSIGADVVFNYKTQSTKEILEKEGPIDIYWDNVGGETLEQALSAANFYARFIECGMISSYNSAPYYVKNLMNIISKEIKISGFTVTSLRTKYQEAFYKEFPSLVASGKIQYKEDLTYGLKHSGQGLLDVQKGYNNGKKVIVVAEE